MSDDDLSERVEALEAEVEGLRETVDTQEQVIEFLAANADISPVSGSCPECGEGVLRKRSGISWAKLRCSDCDAEWKL